MTIKEIAIEYSMTLTAISKRFNIPYRTVQNWSAEVNKCPDYVLNMISEILEKEQKMKIYTANKETGTFIEECATVKEALAKIEEYERNDKEEGIYEEGFYDVVNGAHETILA